LHGESIVVLVLAADGHQDMSEVCVCCSLACCHSCICCTIGVLLPSFRCLMPGTPTIWGFTLATGSNRLYGTCQILRTFAVRNWVHDAAKFKLDWPVDWSPMQLE